MKRLVRFSIRAALFLAVLLAFDQLVLHVPLDLPGVRETRTFYLDFRDRLLNLAEAPKAPSIEATIDRSAGKEQETPSAAASPRYLYVDQHGNLNFADSLEQVPLAYRQDVQRLDN